MLLLLLAFVAAADAEPAKLKKGLVLRLPFASADDVKKAGGKLVKAKVGKEGLELDGDGHVAMATKLDPSNKPLAAGAHVWPDGEQGVILAHGDESHGYSLYLEGGVPVFAVRSDGRLTTVKGDRKLPRGRWAHILAELDEGGKLRLWIDGKALADTPLAGLVVKPPAEGLTVGSDTGGWVGDYKDDNPFTGKLRDVRLYWGMPTEKEVESWIGS